MVPQKKKKKKSRKRIDPELSPRLQLPSTKCIRPVDFVSYLKFNFDSVFVNKISGGSIKKNHQIKKNILKIDKNN